MDTKQFLSMVLPPSGEYYILGGKNKQLRSAKSLTIDGAEALINQHKSRQENVFVGIASFAEGTSRQKQHVTGKQSFYLDIDCGEGKPYPDKGEAFDALKIFLKASKFPAPSLLVDSGRGLHAYWVTKEVVIEAEWASMAMSLKRLAAEHGFKHDAAICGDSARIMRVPGTFNWKDPSNPKPCLVIKNTGLSYSTDELRKHFPKTTNIVPIAGLDKFSGDGFDNIIATSSQPRYMKHIVTECKVAQHIKATAGADADYNLWFAMLTLLLFCEDGDAYVHPFSSGYNKYIATEVAAKWQSRLDDKAAGTTYGATTCDALEAMCPEQCAKCPHWESADRNISWSSPLYFGIAAPKDDIPAPFVLLSNGNTGMYVAEEGGGRYIEEVFHGQMHNLQVFTSDVATILCWEHRLPSKVVKKVEVDATCLVDAKAFKKSLLEVPIVFTDTEAKALRSMTESWVKRIQSAKGEVTAPSSYGWLTEGNRRGFRHMDTVHWDDGTAQEIHTTVSGRDASVISAKGSLEGWQKLASAALEADHIETDVIMAASFAAPLIAMSHIEGAILSAVSLKSGTGKTTAMKLGQGVWGNPSTAMFSLSDTANSILARMGLYNNLPAMWDDIRIPDNQRDAQQKVDMIYQITQGREKSRMNSSAELRSIASWRTLLVCSSNAGLTPYIGIIDQGGTAAQHRVLEFDVAQLPITGACDPLVFNGIGDHYGHAGTVYVQWLLANYETARKTLAANIAAVGKKIQARPEDRFTMTTIAAIYTAACFAGEAGIISFDKVGILKFLIKVFQEHRAEVQLHSREIGSENSIIELLGMFLAEHQMNTATMRKYPRAGAGKVMDGGNLVAPADRETYLSVAIEDREMRILKGKLDKWCRSNGRIGAARELTAIDGIEAGRRNISSFATGGSKALTCYTITYTEETAILFGEFAIVQ